MATEWIRARGTPAVFESHSAEHWDIRSAADLNLEQLRKQGVAFVVTSGFQYERYYREGRVQAEHENLRRKRLGYERLFRFPYVEIEPKHRSYAFSNPLIRIVDIRNK